MAVSCGTARCHSVANAALEMELAAAVRLPRALYFYAGYATNASIVPALVGAGDALFSDALNHTCLIDGARLSKADVQRYAAGWALLPSHTAIKPLIIGDNAAALAAMAALSKRDLWVPAICPPTVPAGTARLRIALSAAHERADIDELLRALRAAARAPSHA